MYDYTDHRVRIRTFKIPCQFSLFAENFMGELLKLFHPLVARWFTERVGRPTRIQRQAWLEIASGSHLLATAPTPPATTFW